MSASTTMLSRLGRVRRLAVAGGLALLLLLALSTAAWANAPMPQSEGPEKCALCHQGEVQEWQESPHANAMTPIDQAHPAECADGESEDCTCLSCHTTNFDPSSHTFSQAGVTCEACHGAYVEGHPANGVMQLDVDSSVCSDCHVETHQDWLNTPHAEAGVQCIGCHRSHSQNLRLADEALCKSCHRDRLLDTGHLAHSRVNINCIDCHTKPTTSLTNASLEMGGSPAPRHEFSVATEVCANCHGQTFHEDDAAMVANTAEGSAFGSPADATVEAQTQESNRWLQTATLLSMGLGVGLGLMVGIVFMLIIGYIYQRQRSSQS